MFLIYWLFFCALGLRYVDAQAQRVAPGVPPQHYQQHNAGQQAYQQVPQQHVPQQHVPQQQMHQQQVHNPQHQQQFQQQIPVQHVQQQAPIQQQAPAQQQPEFQQAAPNHDHGHARHPQQLLNTANMELERAHIADHISVPVDTSKMTDQELQFHYFKMHDADNNNKLDGCELIKSLMHWHAEQGHNDANAENSSNKIFNDEELVSLIDPILNMDDMNKDGFIDYPEFIRAQQKAAATRQ